MNMRVADGALSRDRDRKANRQKDRQTEAINPPPASISNSAAKRVSVVLLAPRICLVRSSSNLCTERQRWAGRGWGERGKPWQVSSVRTNPTPEPRTLGRNRHHLGGPLGEG